MARRAARRRPGLSRRPASRPRSARRSRRCSRAPRLSPTRISTTRRSRPSVRRRRASSGQARPALELRALVGRGLGAARRSADVQRGDRAPAAARGSSPSAASSPTSSAPTSLFRLGVCRYKLSSIVDRDRALRRGARARRAVGPARATSLRSEILQLALALSPPAPRLRRRARRRRARARARAGPRRSACDRERVLPGVARRSAPGSLGAVPQLRAAGEGAVPGAQRRAERRPAPAHARWAHASPRRRGARRRAPEGVLLEGARDRFTRGRRSGARRTGHGCTCAVGEYDQADELARKALDLLQGREDFLHEICPSQLVLGRALLERGRLG